MNSGVQLLLLCLLQFVLVQLDEPTTSVGTSYVFPPEDMFCFFTTSEFIFEERLKEVVPTAQIHKAARLERIHVQVPNTNAGETKSLWGAVYFISNTDKEKIYELAIQHLQLSDVLITMEETSSMSCISLNVGVLPHALPIQIYTAEFFKKVSVDDYLKQLIQIGVPKDYISWLETLPASAKNSPSPEYASSTSSHVSPSIQRIATVIENTNGPDVQSQEIPSDKLCVFVTDSLIFQDAMTEVAPSANLIGGVMLEDQYIALGGQTQAGTVSKHNGFDNIWGAAYTINKRDLPNFIKYGEQFYLIADLPIRAERIKPAECKTFNVGLLPSGFPFSVFKENQLNVQKYMSRLTELKVPENYVKKLENLAYSWRKEPY